MVSYESDFAHSAATWNIALKPALERHKHHQVVEVVDGRIGEFTFFLDTARLFPLFGLPLHLDA